MANGVPAFKPPEAPYARTTMATMSILLGTMLLGIAYLAIVSGAMPSAHLESVLSQVGRATVGLTLPYYVLQISTMAVLIVAAQTSFADFPRVSALLARDGYFPRRFAFRGERMAFNSGIVVLAVISAALVVVFEGHVESLVPLRPRRLYDVHLFAGRHGRHWQARRGPGWRRSALANGLGAVATGIVVIIFAVAKFTEGAWVIIVVVPILVALMLFVHREYEQERRDLVVGPDAAGPQPEMPQHVVVAAPSFTRALVQAVRVARTMGPHVEVIHVTGSFEEAEGFRQQVERLFEDVEVVLVESPYRSLVNPFVRYLETTVAEHPDEVTVVLLPEYLPRHWWDRILDNDNAHRIREALVGRRDIVVLDAPYRREDPAPGPQ